MRLDDRNILAPTRCLYFNPIKSCKEKRRQIDLMTSLHDLNWHLKAPMQNCTGVMTNSLIEHGSDLNRSDTQLQIADTGENIKSWKFNFLSELQ